MYKCVFSGWLSLIKATGQNTAWEHFSLHSKYKIAPGGLVTSLCTALALPILIPSLFTALQMNSAFYGTLSLFIPLPTSAVDTGHLR